MTYTKRSLDQENKTLSFHVKLFTALQNEKGSKQPQFQIEIDKKRNSKYYQLLLKSIQSLQIDSEKHTGKHSVTYITINPLKMEDLKYMTEWMLQHATKHEELILNKKLQISSSREDPIEDDRSGSELHQVLKKI